MSQPDNNTEILEALVLHLRQDFEKSHSQVPSPLFHYTSADGLVGIFSTKRLWLTDLRYMNDLSELQYARQLIASRLSSTSSTRVLDAVEKDFLSRVSQTFDSFQLGNSIYSASFCENGNLLSQWRAYRGRGGGYAIGIDFFHTIGLLDRHCALRKVNYDVADQTQMVDTTIDAFLNCITKIIAKFGAERTVSDFLPRACDAFRRAVVELLFTFKHPGFSEEREWRLVHFANVNPRHNRDVESPRFRAFDGNIIPYFPVSFESAIAASRDDTSGIRFPFVELFIGPTISAELNEDSIISLMLSLNPDFEPLVRQSGIPLRWL